MIYTLNTYIFILFYIILHPYFITFTNIFCKQRNEAAYIRIIKVGEALKLPISNYPVRNDKLSTTMSRALSDDEASKEMKKMVTFILQEASEKAKEIRIKADEEFNIEKAKLVRQETTAIETNFSKRLGQAEVKRKM